MALGARSVPVVAQGGRYVFAQVIGDVVDFLRLPPDDTPVLPPTELAVRAANLLARTVSLVERMPNEQLDRTLADRPRTRRELMHHVFRIVDAFVESEATSVPLSFESLVAPPEPHHRSSSDIAAYGREVFERFNSWWHEAAGSDFSAPVETYFGTTSRHELFERTVWHSMQHARQVDDLLVQLGAQRQASIGPELVEGLPLSDVIWD